jgi:hypothetical protein
MCTTKQEQHIISLQTSASYKILKRCWQKEKVNKKYSLERHNNSGGQLVFRTATVVVDEVERYAHICRIIACQNSLIQTNLLSFRRGIYAIMWTCVDCTYMFTNCDFCTFRTIA